MPVTAYPVGCRPVGKPKVLVYRRLFASQQLSADSAFILTLAVCVVGLGHDVGAWMFRVIGLFTQYVASFIQPY